MPLLNTHIPAQANCWFLVTFIYECLNETFSSSATARFLYMRKGSEEIRHEMKTAARLVITFPFEEVVHTVLIFSSFFHSDY